MLARPHHALLLALLMAFPGCGTDQGSAQDAAVLPPPWPDQGPPPLDLAPPPPYDDLVPSPDHEALQDVLAAEDAEPGDALTAEDGTMDLAGDGPVDLAEGGIDVPLVMEDMTAKDDVPSDGALQDRPQDGPALACTQPTDCPGGVCLRGECLPCHLDQDCSYAYGDNHLCIDGACEPGECRDHFGCEDEGWLCQDRRCLDCRRDQDCLDADPPYGQGHLCIGGRCLEGGCLGHDDCENGELCLNQVCSPCANDDQCRQALGVDHLCHAGACVPGDCHGDGDCIPWAQICLDRFCSPCSQDGQCQAYGADFICQDGSCEEAGCFPLADPAVAGAFVAHPHEYGHAADPQRRTTDVSSYFNSPDRFVRLQMGITMNAVPLQGLGHYPEGEGPFPVVLLVHGNHDPWEASYPGYTYLTSHLATHGIIAYSINEDFLNGAVAGEVDARAIVLLRHLQLFREWNQDPGHPLYHKIDLSRTGLLGHSRGGEAILGAWMYDTTLHNPQDPAHNFAFAIDALFALAPVDGQLGSVIRPDLVTVTDASYFVAHGSNDGDVFDFSGHKAYDRALPYQEPAEADKGLLFVHGANHAQWNTVWAPTADPFPIASTTVPLMSARDQQAVAKDFVTAWFRLALQGQECYRHLAAGEVAFPSLPDVAMNRQFQSRHRAFIDHYEEDRLVSTASYPGATNEGAGLAELEEVDMTARGGLAFAGSTRGLVLAWRGDDGEYRIDLPGGGPAGQDALAMRVGQIYEERDGYNTFGQAQDFSIRLVVHGQATLPLYAADYRELPSVDRVQSRNADFSHTVLDTLRVPLRDFNNGLPLASDAVEAILLSFDLQASGYLGIDEIQFTLW